ncbi:4-hydroxy-tetrahydrodipicolinate reductase [Candidatus Jidaibacter acanthamoeba]|uniref:4-hydroxy-tetrahydrodipicolinate reductase n=1 Tax=Candidatus Jidaibacter acanthamoebae TaxID=86105 RepID=A0A0C1MTH1_9RICK|nr:4-hydroxy-tetrahydrodipicolinate reductase [Candidatus Jidaibacter acanthamoeba]KIE05392.1 4-hydroxy-tetrahydrodipicolinate reductase [Candidatus Jidaibacter acanthamoeba]
MKVGIIGASGRMGQELVKVAFEEMEHNKCQLIGASVRNSSYLLDKEIINPIENKSIGVAYSDNIENIIKNADVIIDFTGASYSLKVAELANKYKTVHICGTTGFNHDEFDRLTEIAKQTVLFWSPNMSIAIYTLSMLAEKAAALLGESFDIEVLEMHHKYKIDAPSGTALMLGKSAAKGRGINFEDSKVLNRSGSNGVRQEGSIGFAALRGGSVVGEHSVIFASANEKIELSHTMYNRKAYAENAFKIAYWASTQLPGKIYTIEDYINTK